MKEEIIRCTQINGGGYDYWLMKVGRVYPLCVHGCVRSTLSFPSVDIGLSLSAVRLMVKSTYSEWSHIDPETWEVGEQEYAILNRVTSVLYRHNAPLPIWTCSICGEQCSGFARFLSLSGSDSNPVLNDPCCEDCFSDIWWCDGCSRFVQPEHQCGATRHKPQDQAEFCGLTGDYVVARCNLEDIRGERL